MEKKISHMFEMGKEDLLSFVNSMIEGDPRTVVGVKAKGSKFAFGTLDSAEELRLDYDVTLLPPKNYFLPSLEPLLRYDLSDSTTQEIIQAEPLVIIGIHPYDLIAIEQMDAIFRDTNQDYHYIRKREKSVLIGVNMQNVSPYAFAGSMGTATTDHGFDLMLTDLGQKYLIEVGTEKGGELLNKYGRFSEADGEAVVEARRIEAEIPSKFQKRINFSPDELPELLEENYDNEIWAKNAEKCLKCGSCNLVCPTCYCFDVQDITELNLKRGERIRTWDGCLLQDFAKVATGENFRGDDAARYRHRFMRKGKYLHDKYGYIACVGCGRCSSACLPDIADPTEVFNTLKGVAV